MAKKVSIKKTKLRPKQNRGQETRKKILEITGTILAEVGLHKLRYAQIAKVAKVPQALMGYHFPNIESLLVDVIQLELEKLKVLSVHMVEKSAAQPKKALAAYIRAPFELAATDSIFRSVFTAFYHLAAIAPIFAEMNLAIRQTGRERILNLITMVLATEGRFTSGEAITRENLIELSIAIQGVITGQALMAASESHADYQEFSALAIANCFKILGLEN